MPQRQRHRGGEARLENGEEANLLGMPFGGGRVLANPKDRASGCLDGDAAKPGAEHAQRSRGAVAGEGLAQRRSKLAEVVC